MQARFHAGVLGSILRMRRKAPEPSPSTPTGLHTLVALQQADGHWDLTAELASILERDLFEITRALRGASGNQGECRQAWATALAIAWLELHAADAEEQWRLLRAKAQNWIDSLAVCPAAGGTWLDAARRFLRS